MDKKSSKSTPASASSISFSFKSLRKKSKSSSSNQQQIDEIILDKKKKKQSGSSSSSADFTRRVTNPRRPNTLENLLNRYSKSTTLSSPSKSTAAAATTTKTTTTTNSSHNLNNYHNNNHDDLDDDDDDDDDHEFKSKHATKATLLIKKKKRKDDDDDYDDDVEDDEEDDDINSKSSTNTNSLVNKSVELSSSWTSRSIQPLASRKYSQPLSPPPTTTNSNNLSALLHYPALKKSHHRHRTDSLNESSSSTAPHKQYPYIVDTGSSSDNENTTTSGEEFTAAAADVLGRSYLNSGTIGGNTASIIKPALRMTQTTNPSKTTTTGANVTTPTSNERVNPEVSATISNNTTTTTNNNPSTSLAPPPVATPLVVSSSSSASSSSSPPAYNNNTTTSHATIATNKTANVSFGDQVTSPISVSSSPILSSTAQTVTPKSAHHVNSSINSSGGSISHNRFVIKKVNDSDLLSASLHNTSTPTRADSIINSATAAGTQQTPPNKIDLSSSNAEFNSASLTVVASNLNSVTTSNPPERKISKFKVKKVDTSTILKSELTAAAGSLTPSVAKQTEQVADTGANQPVIEQTSGGLSVKKEVGKKVSFEQPILESKLELTTSSQLENLTEKSETTPLTATNTTGNVVETGETSKVDQKVANTPVEQQQTSTTVTGQQSATQTTPVVAASIPVTASEQIQKTGIDKSVAAAAAAVDQYESEKEKEPDPIEDEKAIDASPDKRFLKYDIEIGHGSFKTVYKGLDTESGVPVAWCELHDRKFNKSERQRFIEEAEMLKQLQHPNIVRFYDYWEDAKTKPKKIILVTELMTSGTLKAYVQRFKKQEKSKRLKVIKNFANQILKGLAYLHSRSPPVIHRDLKCDNVFVTGQSGQVKIGDLGLATLKKSSFAKSVIGTPEFMAPEMYSEQYDESIDIYAFGMCLLEMATGEYPYQECSKPFEIYKRVTQGIKPENYYRVDSDDLRELIGLCTRLKRNQRPTVKELVSHSWFMENNGLKLDMLGNSEDENSQQQQNENHPNLSPSQVVFRLKVIDKTKRKSTWPVWPENEEIEFVFDVDHDEPESIVRELKDKTNKISDEDLRYLTQCIKDKCLVFKYEREDRMEEEGIMINSSLHSNHHNQHQQQQPVTHNVTSHQVHSVQLAQVGQPSTPQHNQPHSVNTVSTATNLQAALLAQQAAAASAQVLNQTDDTSYETRHLEHNTTTSVMTAQSYVDVDQSTTNVHQTHTSSHLDHVDSSTVNTDSPKMYLKDVSARLTILDISESLANKDSIVSSQTMIHCMLELDERDRVTFNFLLNFDTPQDVVNRILYSTNFKLNSEQSTCLVETIQSVMNYLNATRPNILATKFNQFASVLSYASRQISPDTSMTTTSQAQSQHQQIQAQIQSSKLPTSTSMNSIPTTALTNPLPQQQIQTLQHSIEIFKMLQQKQLQLNMEINQMQSRLDANLNNVNTIMYSPVSQQQFQHIPTQQTSPAQAGGTIKLLSQSSPKQQQQQSQFYLSQTNQIIPTTTSKQPSVMLNQTYHAHSSSSDFEHLLKNHQLNSSVVTLTTQQANNQYSMGPSNTASTSQIKLIQPAQNIPGYNLSSFSQTFNPQTNQILYQTMNEFQSPTDHGSTVTPNGGYYIQSDQPGIHQQQQHSTQGSLYVNVGTGQTQFYLPSQEVMNSNGGPSPKPTYAAIVANPTQTTTPTTTANGSQSSMINPGNNNSLGTITEHVVVPNSTLYNYSNLASNNSLIQQSSQYSSALPSGHTSANQSRKQSLATIGATDLHLLNSTGLLNDTATAAALFEAVDLSMVSRVDPAEESRILSAYQSSINQTNSQSKSQQNHREQENLKELGERIRTVLGVGTNGGESSPSGVATPPTMPSQSLNMATSNYEHSSSGNSLMLPAHPQSETSAETIIADHSIHQNQSSLLTSSNHVNNVAQPAPPTQTMNQPIYHTNSSHQLIMLPNAVSSASSSNPISRRNSVDLLKEQQRNKQSLLSQQTQHSLPHQQQQLPVQSPLVSDYEYSSMPSMADSIIKQQQSSISSMLNNNDTNLSALLSNYNSLMNTYNTFNINQTNTSAYNGSGGLGASMTNSQTSTTFNTASSSLFTPQVTNSMLAQAPNPGQFDASTLKQLEEMFVKQRREFEDLLKKQQVEFHEYLLEQFKKNAQK